jgi:hypothetical protein
MWESRNLEVILGHGSFDFGRRHPFRKGEKEKKKMKMKKR